MSKKQSSYKIISGVFILTFSNLLVKLLGLFFKIPLHSFLGDQGMGYFNIAYNIFTTLYMVSTAGLPIAVSILVSGSRTDGRKREVRRIFRMALLVFFFLGATGSSIMLFGATPLSKLVGSENSRFCIMTVAPTLFFICISSAIRGFFQGHQNMTPTAVSEIIEAIGKFGIGIALAYYAISHGKSIEIAAAYAIAGIGIGVVCGSVFLMGSKMFFSQDYTYQNGIDNPLCENNKAILKNLLTIAIPITISAVALNLNGIIDSVTIINRMDDYCSLDAAEAAYGNYSTLAVTLTHLPSALITPIASVLTPTLASFIKSGNTEKGKSAIMTALKFAAIIAIPSAIGMSVLSKPILLLLFNQNGTKEASVNSAAPLLSILAISVLFTAMLTITNSILQTHGLERKPVISMLTGAGVKLVLNYILIGIPHIGIYGAPIGTLISYFVMAAMNFYFVTRYIHIEIAVLKIFFKPFVSSIMVSAVTLATYKILYSKIGNDWSTIISIIVTVILYVILLFAFKTIHKEEIMLLPKGEKICTVLKKIKML